MAQQRSRKAHLAKLAEARRIRREDKDDSPYTESIGKEDVDEDIPDEAINDFLAIEPPIERVCEASKRADGAYKKRRARERLQDLPHEARFRHSWLSPTAEEARIVHREAVAVVAACIEEAVSIVKAQEEMVALALKASMERARYASRKRVRQPFARDEAPRMSRTFSGSCAPAHKNTSAPKNVKGVAPSRKLAKRRKSTADMVDAIYRMARARMFKKADVWGGATMSRAEWRVARTDYKGLGRINAMRCYLALRKQGMLARPAFEQAATLVPVRPTGKVYEGCSWSSFNNKVEN
jgi:hypothetical protein